VALHSRVEVGERRPGLDGRAPARRIDADRAHRGKVDDEPAIGNRIARNVMPAAADRDRQPAPARKCDRWGDVVRARALHDRGRAPVDHSVPDFP